MNIPAMFLFSDGFVVAESADLTSLRTLRFSGIVVSILEELFSED